MGSLFSRPLAARPALPVTDIVSFAFDRQRQYDDEKALFISAEDPSQFLTANQTIALVRKLIAGLHTAGLQRGDAVLLHLANHVSADSLGRGALDSESEKLASLTLGKTPH